MVYTRCPECGEPLRKPVGGGMRCPNCHSTLKVEASGKAILQSRHRPTKRPTKD